METISGGGGRTTDAEDITSGTFVKERIPSLPTTKIIEGTFGLARIPSIDDARIPNLETLSYGGAFADAQIPNLGAGKIISGTFTLARIPGTLTGKDADSVDGADAGVVANDIFKIPAGIAQGDIFHVNAGGSVVKLSAGTTGHFLKTQGAGANPQWASVPGGGDMLKSVYDTGGNSIVDNSERLEGNTLGSVRDHSVEAAKITSGTFDDARIPDLGLNDLEDVNTAGTANGKVLTFQSGTWIPEAVAGGGDMLKSVYVTGQGTVYNASRLEGETLATVQAHGVDAGTITQGTIGLARIPTMDDAHIPNLETLSYGAAFADAQIPDLPTVKITSGTFDSDRIPILPIDRYGSAVLVSGTRLMEGTLNMGSHPVHAAKELTFQHDAKFRSSSDYNVRLESKDEVYVVSLYMGHLKMVYNINTYGTLDMHGHPAINFPTPTLGSHAANKTYVDAAKQFWVPVTFGSPTDLSNYGNYPVCHLTLTNYSAYMSFCVPDDFHSITEAKVVVIPRNTHASANWNIYSHYGAAGESYMQHNQGDTTTTYSVSNGVVFEVDISGILTSLAAGDYVGIRFFKGDDWAYVDVLGIMFKYT